MRRMRIPFVGTTALLLGLTLCGPAWADQARPTRLVLQVGPAQLDARAVQLSAQLQEAGGRPVGSEEVAFYVRSSDFGGVWEPLGIVTTDAAGIALLTYRSSWTGSQHFEARFNGSARLGASRAEASSDVTAVQPYRSATSPLASEGRALGVVAAVLTVLIWLLLILILVKTSRKLPELAHQADVDVRPPVRSVEDPIR